MKIIRQQQQEELEQKKMAELKLEVALA